MGGHCSMFDFRWPALTMRYIGENRRFIAKIADISREITDFLRLIPKYHRTDISSWNIVSKPFDIVTFSSLDFTTWRWFRNLEMICNLIRSLEVISQPRAISQPRSIFAGWRHFRSPFRSFQMGLGGCEMVLVCQGVVSQLWNILRNFRSSFRLALRGCLQTAITSLFQLQFMHRLKSWTPDFLSFETRYSMHEIDSRKYSKCVQQFPSSWISC